MTSAVLGKWVTCHRGTALMFTWNPICLFLNVLILFFFFFLRSLPHVEVSYNGEYRSFIHYLILLFLSQVLTEVGVASHIGQPIVEGLSLSFPLW